MGSEKRVEEHFKLADSVSLERRMEEWLERQVILKSKVTDRRHIDTRIRLKP